MKRHLLNLVALFSLLVSAALGALWVRSYFVSDKVRHGYAPDPNRHGVAYHADFNHGIAHLRRWDFRYAGEGPTPVRLGGPAGRAPRWYRDRPHCPHSRAERFYIAFRYYDTTYVTGMPGVTERLRELVLPLWPGVVASAVPPALLLRWRLRTRRRARHRLCAGCGYDLRESPGRCPECGLIAAPPEQVTSPA